MTTAQAMTDHARPDEAHDNVGAVVAMCADSVPTAPVVTRASVRLVPELCDHPRRLADVAAGADALVVGLCPGGHSHREIQSVARSLGLDALAVEFLDVESAAGDRQRLDLLAGAAVARASRFAGSRPEHAKPVFPPALGRRSFLRLPLPEYVAAPAVEQDLCAAGDGCQACVDACPNGAYEWVDGRMTVNVNKCEPCGLCLSACPTGAAQNPAWTPEQFRAEVRALLDGTDEPRGIAFACRRGASAETTRGWYPVALPCTGMLTAGRLLAPLLMGAAAVAVRPCGATGCPLGNDSLVTSVVEHAHQLLEALGFDAQRVTFEAYEALPAPLAATVPVEAFGPLGEHAVVLALAQAAGVPSPAGVRVSHPSSRAGLLAVDPAVCTLCGACAAACPTGALRFDRDGDAAILTHDARACVACEQCLPRCPERDAGAIAVEHAIGLDELSAGPTVQHQGRLAVCDGCGKPFSSERLLDHVASLLGADHAEMFAAVRGKCLDCRSSFVGNPWSR